MGMFELVVYACIPEVSKDAMPGQVAAICVTITP